MSPCHYNQQATISGAEENREKQIVQGNKRCILVILDVASHYVYVSQVIFLSVCSSALRIGG